VGAAFDEPGSGRAGEPGAPLASIDEKLLLRRYAEAPDPALEAELVRRLTPFARSLALRYRSGGEQAEDLIQVALLALVKALRGFDPDRGDNFLAYAAPTILGELRRHFRDHTWRLHVPRSLQERTLAVDRTSESLAEELGVTPTARQIARRLGESEERVLDAFQARQAQRSISLDMPVNGDDSGSVPKLETIGGIDQRFEDVEAQLAIERCVEFAPQEREALRLRFVEELSQHEIGDRLGVSQMQVSRVLRRGLAKLLEAVQGDEHPDGRRTFQDDGRDPRFPDGRSRRRRRAGR